MGRRGTQKAQVKLPKDFFTCKEQFKVLLGALLSTAFLSHQQAHRPAEQLKLEEALEGLSGPTLLTYLSPTAGILPSNHSYNTGRRKASCFSQPHHPGFYRPC